jgi:DNA modification methylase
VTPWLADADVALYHGEVEQVLAELPERSIQTCVTSPPYWGLRDYGTGTWTGGDESCDHVERRVTSRDGLAEWSAEHARGGGHKPADAPGIRYLDVCGECGARRVDDQLGLEPTPEEYVERLVRIFRGVWRVLRDDGTLWLNLGDTYSSGGRDWYDGSDRVNGSGRGHASRPDTPRGLKPKDLCMIPARVAIALQADGWYLRQDIIWNKPNPLPESVQDRPTKAHEYLFLLTKAPRYYYDATAIREPASPNTHPRGGGVGMKNAATQIGQGIKHNQDYTSSINAVVAARNKRSVWTVPSEPFPEAHFATYPQQLVEPCIMAGSSEHGECRACGTPWARVTRSSQEAVGGRQTNGPRSLERRQETAGFAVRTERRVESVGWEPGCSCGADIQPQTILDPFIGSGTTAHVARRLGRRCVGIDLSEPYLQIAARRLQQQSLFA